MDKRYQVFVSSTFEDLQAERQEVMQALLELDCIPSGMELFPAANEDQWSLIKKVISDCDYYVVILGGRYGSIAPGGLSYTEMEYKYALEVGKPIIAFLHKDPTSIPLKKGEQTDEGRARLLAFRNQLEKRICKHWSSPSDLGSAVSRSLVRLIKAEPAVGWIRADQVAEGVAATEMLRLRKRIEELEASLQQTTENAPPGTQDLAQKDDPCKIDFTFESTSANEQWDWNYSVTITWDELLYDLGPILVEEITDRELRAAITGICESRSKEDRDADKNLEGHTYIRNFKVDEHDFQTIKIQLRALGLMVKSDLLRSVNDTATYWTLTAYGDQLVMKLRALTHEDVLNREEATNDQEDETPPQ